MANKKITQLAPLTSVPANTSQLTFLAVDSSGVTPITKQLRFDVLYDFIDNLGLSAYTTANDSYSLANTNSSRITSLTQNVNTILESTSISLNVLQTRIDTATNLANSANANTLVYITDAPLSNKGATGHKKGMVHLGQSYLYYCNQDYDNGSANIWSRVDSTSNW
jgi:hypothetical protein